MPIHRAARRKAPTRASAPMNSIESPAGRLGHLLEELRLIGLLGRRAHHLVDALRVLADENAPTPGLDAIEDDLGGLRGRRGRLLEEESGSLDDQLSDILVR